MSDHDHTPIGQMPCGCPITNPPKHRITCSASAAISNIANRSLEKMVDTLQSELKAERKNAEWEIAEAKAERDSYRADNARLAALEVVKAGRPLDIGKASGNCLALPVLEPFAGDQKELELPEELLKVILDHAPEGDEVGVDIVYDFIARGLFCEKDPAGAGKYFAVGGVLWNFSDNSLGKPRFTANVAQNSGTIKMRFGSRESVNCIPKKECRSNMGRKPRKRWRLANPRLTKLL